MLFDQFTQRNAHRFFDRARLFDVTGNGEQLGTVVVFTAKA